MTVWFSRDLPRTRHSPSSETANIDIQLPLATFIRSSSLSGRLPGDRPSSPLPRHSQTTPPLSILPTLSLKPFPKPSAFLVFSFAAMQL